MTQKQNATDMSATLARIAELSGISEAEVTAMYEKAQKGASVAEMFHIPPASLEAGYALACNLYAAGKTRDAETMYRSLCQFDGSTPRNWIGLGCCLEKRSEYREAVFCFAQAAELGYPLNAKPLYLLAKCCLSVQDKEAAHKVLEVAVIVGDETDVEQMRYRKMAQELLTQLV